MSKLDKPIDAPRRSLGRALVKTSRWPGWIWAVPLAALALVVWLAVRSFTSRGPEVTVVFQGGAALTPTNTKVKFQDMIVGQVEDVSLEKDLKHMTVKLSLHTDMEGHLGPGTQFWIGGKTISVTDLSGLQSLIT
ncbi:MAG: MCE family protein, partial [Acetobacteraceae bacterium]|nr:MCE family protein [Acetobacteraceae bacterium]